MEETTNRTETLVEVRDLAKHYGEGEKVKERWQEYLAHEAQIMDELSLRGDRMH